MALAPGVVGIDFVESYSRLAIVKNNQSEVVADSQGERQIPCIVGFYPMPPLVGLEQKGELLVHHSKS